MKILPKKNGIGNRLPRGAYPQARESRQGNPERCDIVAVESDSVCELASGDLHTVAGIACEADDRAVDGSGLVFEGGSVINVDIIAEFLGP